MTGQLAGSRSASHRRVPKANSGPLAGARIELDIEAVAAGGHCVARHAGRVVFVRHTLPGERVVALVTEDRGGAFCRADAVEVLTAARDRVEPPCAHAGPGRCGGCDWQHVTPEAQRRLKGDVVRDALRRIGGFPADAPVLRGFRVAALDPPALGWRTRAQFTVARDGRPGLRRHRSHSVEPVRDCPLVTSAVRTALAGRRDPPGATVDITATAHGDVAVDLRRGRRPSGPGAVLIETALGRDWQVHSHGFWQVHRQAVDVLAACVCELLAPLPGERALDLYSGVGVLAGALAERVGDPALVTAVESDATAAADAVGNVPGLTVLAEPVTAQLLADCAPVDLVVLDPPRSGAGADIMAALVAGPARAIAYVACDPAALARDLRTACDAGWEMRALCGFDLFPMTAHVECVALLTPAAGRGQVADAAAADR